MTRKLNGLWILSLGFLLTACSAAPAAPSRLSALPAVASATPSDARSVDNSVPAVIPPASGATPAPYQTLTDDQGAVEFAVTPLNLANPGEILDFDISMTTHSKDLSWDLAALSELTTDTGVKVSGLRWPVGNGHHYGATLSFPSKTMEGAPILRGAKKLTLTIRNAGAAERIFEWTISP